MNKNEILRQVDIVAQALGERCNDFVLVGGAAAALLITDPGAPDVRPTKDVDVVVEVTSYLKYSDLCEELRRNFGFKNEMNGPICRFTVNGVSVDVMPADGSILGFSNIWYQEAINCANLISLPSDLSMNMISAPMLLCTKIEAFLERGNGDFRTSHDIEDIMAVVDGRPSLVDECRDSSLDSKAYIRKELASWVRRVDFDECLECHVQTPGRIKMVKGRIVQLSCLT